MIAKRHRAGTPIRRVARMLTTSRRLSTTRVRLAWEEGAVPGANTNHRRLVVLIESAGIAPRYALFDNLYEGLPQAQVENHTAVLRRLLADLGTAGVVIETVANPVVPTRRVRATAASEYLLQQPIEPPRSARKTPRPRWASAGLAIGTCAMAACTVAHTQPPAESPVFIANARIRPVVQVSQQRSGMWQLVPCVEGECVRPTPKTLVGLQPAPGTVPVALPVEVSGAPGEGGPKLEASGGEARHVESLPVRSVFFQTGSSVPDPSQTAAIRSLAPMLAAAKGIVVIGCTDRTGTRAGNRRLAEQRAAALRDQLVRLGVPKEKIEVQIDLSGDGNLPGVGVTGTTPGDINARARRGDIAIA